MKDSIRKVKESKFLQNSVRRIVKSSVGNLQEKKSHYVQTKIFEILERQYYFLRKTTTT